MTPILKVVLIRKSKKGSDYHSAAVLLPPVKSGETWKMIGIIDEVVKELPQSPISGSVYAVHDTKIPVQYQVKIREFLEAQIGKKRRKAHWYLRYLRDVSLIQEGRKKCNCWDSAELVMAALHKSGCFKLFSAQEPFEMTPNYIAKSPNLYFRGTVKTKEEII